MRRERKKRTKIIISLVVVLTLMTAGYAAFQTNLKINGTSTINNSWNIEITNVTSGQTTGGAENVRTPTWTTLTASMEANLYEKGDAIEYDITLKNKGTVDARLSDIIQTAVSNNDAIKITFSNYTKGEVLTKNTTKTIRAKIEYDPTYSGPIDTTTATEISISFNYTQAKGGGDMPTPNTYVLDYDCVTNYGTDCSNYNEYLYPQEPGNLEHEGTAHQFGLEFIGWNTDPDATVGLSQFVMGQANTTLYAIYEPDVITINSANTTSSLKTISVVVSATATSGIKKYAYTKDGGETWVESNDPTYTFTNLSSNTGYKIQVKVISNTNKEKIHAVEIVTCPYDDGHVWNFPYTGAYQTFPIECEGEYTFEAWGSQGAEGGNNAAKGGKGAYTVGTIKLDNSRYSNIYAYVGQQGNSGDTNKTYFNAGTATQNGWNGGGATDFRLVNGAWDNLTSLTSRIMVAGAGGTSFQEGTPGYGGAFTGGSGVAKGGRPAPTGGTQIGIGTSDDSQFALSTFGVANGGCSGGSGYYPGGGAWCAAGSGGGSSFVSGHIGCVAVAKQGSTSPRPGCTSGTTDPTCSYHYSDLVFKNSNMIAGNATVPTTDGESETGHSGPGHARITLNAAVIGVKTDSLDTATFSVSGNNLTIDFKGQCTGGNTCKYRINGESEITVTSNPTIALRGSGEVIVAKVSDGTDTEISSYTAPIATNCTVNKTWTYSSAQANTWTAPCKADYKIELWGAQGASGGSYSATGGKGAYTIGTINLPRNQVLYAYVGATSTSTTLNSKTFNNGTASGGGWNGGGATDIRLVNGDWDNTTSLTSRIMVAGGGGTAYQSGVPGVGGALTGGSSSGGKTGGTQISVGTGGTYMTSYFGIANGGCSGGNGYWPASGVACASGSGGGSSYISGYTGCVAVAGAGNTSPKSGCTTGTTNVACSYHYSGLKFSYTNMIAGNASMPTPAGTAVETGHSGAGAAKITLVGID